MTTEDLRNLERSVSKESFIHLPLSVFSTFVLNFNNNFIQFKLINSMTQFHTLGSMCW